MSTITASTGRYGITLPATAKIEVSPDSRRAIVSGADGFDGVYSMPPAPAAGWVVERLTSGAIQGHALFMVAFVSDHGEHLYATRLGSVTVEEEHERQGRAGEPEVVESFDVVEHGRVIGGVRIVRRLRGTRRVSTWEVFAVGSAFPEWTATPNRGGRREDVVRLVVLLHDGGRILRPALDARIAEGVTLVETGTFHEGSFDRVLCTAHLGGAADAESFRPMAPAAVAAWERAWAGTSVEGACDVCAGRDS